MDKAEILAALTQGEPATLGEVLVAREWRQARQKQWLSQYPQAVLVALKLNIPGPIKNNALIQRLFQKNVVAFTQAIATRPFTALKEATWASSTGPEHFWLLDTQDVAAIKRLTMTVEAANFVGRLADFDVHSWDAALKAPTTIKRQTVGGSVRRCYVCQEPAMVCARSRHHSVATLQQVIAEKLARVDRKEDV